MRGFAKCERTPGKVAKCETWGKLRSVIIQTVYRGILKEFKNSIMRNAWPAGFSTLLPVNESEKNCTKKFVWTEIPLDWKVLEGKPLDWKKGFWSRG